MFGCLVSNSYLNLDFRNWREVNLWVAQGFLGENMFLVYGEINSGD
jgi:hypothetical protein